MNKEDNWSLSCGIFLSKASRNNFELFMNSHRVVTEPNPLSCKLFWFLLQHSSPFITRLFTFATAHLILDESSYLWTRRNGHRKMKSYGFGLIFHKSEFHCVSENMKFQIMPLKTFLQRNFHLKHLFRVVGGCSCLALFCFFPLLLLL